MMEYRFIEPMDRLFLRGNRLFGEGPGAGEAVMPPWPSVFAGALRTWMLSSAGVSPGAYGRNAAQAVNLLAPALADCLGTPAEPGSFAVADLRLARRTPTGLESLYPVPNDVQIFASADGVGDSVVRQLTAVTPPAGLRTSQPLDCLPVLRQSVRAKPLGGHWLTATGWGQYWSGQCPGAEHVVSSDKLWRRERYIGIELDRDRRAAANGQLYSTDSISLADTSSVGFLVGVAGVAAGLLPEQGVIRLGGDGRGAVVSPVSAEELTHTPAPPLADKQRFRVVLTTPGIFPEGWRLPGMAANGAWTFPGGQARCIAASVPRGGVVSGWDVSQNQPKPAHRVAPAGSVYWFDGIEGDAEALGNLSKNGLWGLTDDNHQPTRRAEGFNRCIVANAQGYQ